ncbi:fibropellin-1-like isoform X2 [Dendronephthya gigantea]|uniref:fibropellin-1-like isoform X2 n=1 Tax=Dendronephthya gigantea TaxID=151771 RepID=UPI00106B6A1D|nr:fibropellin-1-like isoform X2 [Dendronephthya gigantea]
MLRIALVVILFQVVLQTGCTEALCCDDIRSDIKNHTLAYNLLCSKHDPQLGSCCRVIERNIRRHKLALRILCPNNETDHCKSNPCGPNAVCVSNTYNYTCTCKPGYTGPGTNCTKIDPCSSNPCNFNTDCISDTYYYTCACKPGYTGTGNKCTKINHCASNPCDVNAVCVSNTYNYTCTCKLGYTGPGTNCTKIDRCPSNPCAVNAICVSYSNHYTCICKPGYTGPGTNCTAVTGRSCARLYNIGVRKDGVYTINPDGLGSFQVRCDMRTDGGGWTVFQRRQDGSQDFFLGWSDYKAGFGDLNGDFWLGLDKIHRLTKSGQNVLRVDMMKFSGDEGYAKYGTFSVADESDKYRLTVGSFSGNARDSLVYHNHMQFTTKDSDNDAAPNNCAQVGNGAWWYKNCYHSNLNGIYQQPGQTRDHKGAKWITYAPHSLKKMEMKVRPSKFPLNDNKATATLQNCIVFDNIEILN